MYMPVNIWACLFMLKSIFIDISVPNTLDVCQQLIWIESNPNHTFWTYILQWYYPSVVWSGCYIFLLFLPPCFPYQIFVLYKHVMDINLNVTIIYTYIISENVLVLVFTKKCQKNSIEELLSIECVKCSK
jgi:hypothetical protein